jgi:hypothetical protein
VHFNPTWIQVGIYSVSLLVGLAVQYVNIEWRIDSLDNRFTQKLGAIERAVEVQGEWIEKQRNLNIERGAREAERKSSCKENAYKDPGSKCFNLPSDEEIDALRKGG